uniref:Uncharacterized protein n=1 Tax=Triticum urartu TaxID=4572 RepID=A0A8R7QL58_TRIUA
MDNEGWDLGLTLFKIVVLFGSLPFYRHQTAHKISLGCLYHQFDGFQPNCANSGVRTVHAL